MTAETLPAPSSTIPSQRSGRIVETGEADWSFGAEVHAAARKAAAMTYKKWNHLVPFDDLLIEAQLWAATHPRTLRAHADDPEKGLDYSEWAMRSALDKVCAREARWRDRHVSLEALQEWGLAQGL